MAAELAARAHVHFDEARTALSQLDQSKIRPARMMMAVYERLLQKLEARGFADIQVKVRLNTFEKFWLVLRHGVLGL